jgi:predicted RecA/RadA family phage recombinase
MSQLYKRNNTDVNKYRIGAMLRSDWPTVGVTGTTPAATAALPAPGAVVQEFTPVSRDTTIGTVVCSGTVLLVGDCYGILAADTPVSTSAEYFTTGEFWMLQDAGATPAVGADAYIIPASCLVTEVSSSNVYIGTYTTVGVVNPPNQPAGTYAGIRLNQTEK